MRSKISLPVGAFASKSRLITSVNCSRVRRTEKSSCPRKFAGNTRRPCRFTTNGFTCHLSQRRRAPRLRCGSQVETAVDRVVLPGDGTGLGVGEELHDAGAAGGR